MIAAGAVAILSFTSVAAHAQAVSVEVDLFELQEGKGDDPFVFDTTVTAGGDRHALVLKAEGGNETAHLSVEEVTSMALAAFMPNDSTSFMAGVRHDFRPGGDLTYAALAVEQSFGSILEGEHFFFLSENGDLTGEGQIVAGIPLTPGGLTVEPRLAFGWAAQAIPEEEVGSGLTDTELSLRLRQAIGPVFNVYVGVVHERLIGNTRDIARANEESGQATRAILGAGLFF